MYRISSRRKKRGEGEFSLQLSPVLLDQGRPSPLPCVIHSWESVNLGLDRPSHGSSVQDSSPRLVVNSLLPEPVLWTDPRGLRGSCVERVPGQTRRRQGRGLLHLTPMPSVSRLMSVIGSQGTGKEMTENGRILDKSTL